MKRSSIIFLSLFGIGAVAVVGNTGIAGSVKAKIDGANLCDQKPGTEPLVFKGRVTGCVDPIDDSFTTRDEIENPIPKVIVTPVIKPTRRYPPKDHAM